MIPARRSRWALSFADLCLLLLGFFVLLEAHRQSGGDGALAGLNAYFAGHPQAAARRRMKTELPASALFVEGEAVLSPAGHTRLAAIAGDALATGTAVRLSSRGTDPGTARFDGWDLAAARLGAIARGLVQNGMAPASIRLSGPDSDAAAGSGQIILLSTEPLARAQK